MPFQNKRGSVRDNTAYPGTRHLERRRIDSRSGQLQHVHDLHFLHIHHGLVKRCHSHGWRRGHIFVQEVCIGCLIHDLVKVDGAFSLQSC